ncbi:hypothetical protein Avbf_15320, partial [Armadillidium vulgare]
MEKIIHFLIYIISICNKNNGVKIILLLTPLIILSCVVNLAIYIVR